LLLAQKLGLKLSLSPSVLEQTGKTSIIRGFGFLGKETGWKFAARDMGGQTFTAFSAFWAVVGARAFHGFVVFTRHGMFLLKIVSFIQVRAYSFQDEPYLDKSRARQPIPRTHARIGVV